jgi:hypothetical protein
MGVQRLAEFTDEGVNRGVYPTGWGLKMLGRPRYGHSLLRGEALCAGNSVPTASRATVHIRCWFSSGRRRIVFVEEVARGGQREQQAVSDLD